MDSTLRLWSGTLNVSFDYGVNDQLSPTVIDSSSGIDFSPGGTIVVTYVSGVTDAFGADCTVFPFACVGPEGYVGSPFKNDDPGTSGNYFPSLYMPADWDTFLNALVGTFADATGTIFGTPFEIGFGRSLVIPAGATQTAAQD